MSTSIPNSQIIPQLEMPNDLYFCSEVYGASTSIVWVSHGAQNYLVMICSKTALVLLRLFSYLSSVLRMILIEQMLNQQLWDAFGTSSINFANLMAAKSFHATCRPIFQPQTHSH